MLTFTASEAKTRLSELLDRVQQEPVQLTRHNRVVGVMVSANDYAAMRAFYADRLRQTMAATSGEAAAQGLTASDLVILLAAES